MNFKTKASLIGVLALAVSVAACGKNNDSSGNSAAGGPSSGSNLTANPGAASVTDLSEVSVSTRLLGLADKYEVQIKGKKIKKGDYTIASDDGHKVFEDFADMILSGDLIKSTEAMIKLRGVSKDQGKRAITLAKAISKRTKDVLKYLMKNHKDQNRAFFATVQIQDAVKYRLALNIASAPSDNAPAARLQKNDQKKDKKKGVKHALYGVDDDSSDEATEGSVHDDEI